MVRSLGGGGGLDGPLMVRSLGEVGLDGPLMVRSLRFLCH